MHLLKYYIGEARANLAQCLVDFEVWIIYRQKIGSKQSRTLSSAIITANRYYIKCVSKLAKIVFFEFDPIPGPARTEITRSQILNHQAFSPVLDSILQKLINLINVFALLTFDKGYN
jgi:hypothetical protein